MHFSGNFTTTLKMTFLTQLPTILSATYWKKQRNIHIHRYIGLYIPVKSVGLHRKIYEETPPQASSKLMNEN